MVQFSLCCLYGSHPNVFITKQTTLIHTTQVSFICYPYIYATCCGLRMAQVQVETCSVYVSVTIELKFLMLI